MIPAWRWWLPALPLLLVLAGCRSRAALPELGTAPAFSMTDQAGKSFTNETVRGKVWAAAFVFTRCPTICPRVTRSMRGVQEAAARRKVPLHLVSFTIDPENDTPEVLRAYAGAHGADLSTWSFVAGDASAVRTTAERGFKIAVEGTADPSKPDFGITHGTQLVLLDGEARIRGYYASSDPSALEKLVDDAARLAP